MSKSTNVDFHLSVETSQTGSALLNASWNVQTDRGRFQFQVESMVADSAGQAIALMSHLQESLTNTIYDWDKCLGDAELTPT